MKIGIQVGISVIDAFFALAVLLVSFLMLPSLLGIGYQSVDPAKDLEARALYGVTLLNFKVSGLEAEAIQYAMGKRSKPSLKELNMKQGNMRVETELVNSRGPVVDNNRELIKYYEIPTGTCQRLYLRVRIIKEVGGSGTDSNGNPTTQIRP